MGNADELYATEWTEFLARQLAEPFPAEAHKTKRQGGTDITFVDVHRYKDRLNTLVGPHGWGSTVRFDVVGGKLIATVALTVLGVTKENVGDEVEEPPLNERGNEKIIGSPSTNSYAQAFKRACADFGLGAYLYDEDKRNAAKGGAPPTSAQHGPSGNGGGMAASGKQLGLIKHLKSAAVITDAERAQLDQRIGRGMTKKEASDAIEWLQGQIDTREKAQAGV